MKSIRDKIADNARPFLHDGEQVQAVFAAQTQVQYWALLALMPFLIMNKYRCVIATDRRILVTDSGKFTMTKSKSIVAELPRDTLIGEPTGLWWKTERLGMRLYVNKRFFKDVRAADAARPGA